MKGKIFKILSIIILAIAIINFSYTSLSYCEININLMEQYSALVENASVENGIDKNLIYAIIKVESNFDEFATSRKGAMGLMQVKEKTGIFISKLRREKFIKEDLYIASRNIAIGTQYFRYLLDKFDDIDLAIIAYNAGEGNLIKWLKSEKIEKNGVQEKLRNIPYRETERYLKEVKKNYKKYKRYEKVVDKNKINMINFYTRCEGGGMADAYA